MEFQATIGWKQLTKYAVYEEKQRASHNSQNLFSPNIEQQYAIEKEILDMSYQIFYHSSFQLEP